MTNLEAKASSRNVAQRFLSKTAGQTKMARALRVYEYEDSKGVILWSFTKLPFNTTRRLNVVDIRGTHFRSHISDIHQMAFARQLLEEDE